MCRGAQMWIHMCGVHVCGGIQMCWYTWMGGNGDTCVGTYIHVSAHACGGQGSLGRSSSGLLHILSAQDLTGMRSHHIGKASWPVNCNESAVSAFHLSSSGSRGRPGMLGFSCGLWVSEIRLSCLQGEWFTCRAVYPPENSS